MTKGEKSELVFKRVYNKGIFLSCNSRSSETFIGSSCNLKPYGARCSDTLLHYCFTLLELCFVMSSGTYDVLFCMLFPHKCYRTHAELHQAPYFIMYFKFFILYIKCMYELQDIGGDLHDSSLQVCIASKAHSSLCTSSGGVLLYLAIKFLNIGFYTSYIYFR